MESVYKWGRVVAAIFVAILLLICSTPFVIVALKGFDETTMPMLITSLFFLVFLVYSALSFRFMHKSESNKKRKIGLAMLISLILGLFVYSLYVEKKREELRIREEALRLEMQKLHKKINQDNAVSAVLKGMIKELEQKKEAKENKEVNSKKLKYNSK